MLNKHKHPDIKYGFMNGINPSDFILLEFILKKIGITKEILIEEYNTYKNNENKERSKMLDKTKYKLKHKLMKWLEIEQIQYNLKEYIRQNNKDIFNHESNIKNCEKLICEQQEQINALNRTLQSIVSVGTDVDSRRPTEGSRSWAVVCIEGRYNIVKFIDLQGQDYRSILDYLKQFECSRRVIDTPYKQMFNEDFIWFSNNNK